MSAAGERSQARTTCHGCGLVLPAKPSASTHGYIGASAECWALYGELLAREYGDSKYFAVHQLTVDAYAAQHPGRPERRSTRSVALHLITLCLALEQGMEPAHGPRVHARLAARSQFHWLEPPAPIGRLTVADVLGAGDPDEHERLVRGWAHEVWSAWAQHHATVRGWIERDLGDR